MISTLVDNLKLQIDDDPEPDEKIDDEADEDKIDDDDAIEEPKEESF